MRLAVSRTYRPRGGLGSFLSRHQVRAGTAWEESSVVAAFPLGVLDRIAPVVLRMAATVAPTASDSLLVPIFNLIPIFSV